MCNIKEFLVTEEFYGQRLDKFLSQRLCISLRKARYLIEKQTVFVNSFPGTARYKLKKEDKILLKYDSLGENLPAKHLDIIYSDNFFLQ